MKILHLPTEKLAYTVQFELPVDNPENNVGVTVEKKVFHFVVPLNHPRAHIMGFVELHAAAQRKELLALSTGLNNTGSSVRENHSKVDFRVANGNNP